LPDPAGAAPAAFLQHADSSGTLIGFDRPASIWEGSMLGDESARSELGDYPDPGWTLAFRAMEQAK